MAGSEVGASDCPLLQRVNSDACHGGESGWGCAKVSCQLKFCLFVSCQLNFGPVVSCQATLGRTRGEQGLMPPRKVFSKF